MKRFFIIFLPFFCSINLSAQTANKVDSNTGTTIITKVADTEEVLLIKELVYDFGKIPQGKPVTHIFEVVNKGKDSLKISNVQASCGCTTPDWEKNKVQAPNQPAFITVGYNAANEGNFEKMITVTYNDNKTKQIIIKGNVWSVPLSSAPENKDLTNLKD